MKDRKASEIRRLLSCAVDQNRCLTVGTRGGIYYSVEASDGVLVWEDCFEWSDGFVLMDEITSAALGGVVSKART